jgi:hypothetical protein
MRTPQVVVCSVVSSLLTLGIVTVFGVGQPEKTPSDPIVERIKNIKSDSEALQLRKDLLAQMTSWQATLTDEESDGLELLIMSRNECAQPILAAAPNDGFVVLVTPTGAVMRISSTGTADVINWTGMHGTEYRIGPVNAYYGYPSGWIAYDITSIPRPSTETPPP